MDARRHPNTLQFTYSGSPFKVPFNAELQLSPLPPLSTLEPSQAPRLPGAPEARQEDRDPWGSLPGHEAKAAGAPATALLQTPQAPGGPVTLPGGAAVTEKPVEDGTNTAFPPPPGPRCDTFYTVPRALSCSRGFGSGVCSSLASRSSPLPGVSFHHSSLTSGTPRPRERFPQVSVLHLQGLSLSRARWSCAPTETPLASSRLILGPTLAHQKRGRRQGKQNLLTGLRCPHT